MTFVLGLLLVLVALALLLRWAEPRLIYLPLRDLEATPAAVGLPFEDVWLAADDDTRILGWFVPPPTASAPHVLFLLCEGGERPITELGRNRFAVDRRPTR